MNVVQVDVSNFRSISYSKLEECGGFNVLIGKNNSGKSNLLFAINAFFSAVNDGSAVCLDPPITKEVDYHNRNYETPAEITLTFSLNDNERAELMAGINADSPQMTNAVNSLEMGLRLRVKIAFNIEPAEYAYVKQISLVPHDDVTCETTEREAIILAVDEQASIELSDLHGQHENIERQSQGLSELYQGIDRRAWDRLNAEGRESRVPYRPPRFSRIMRNLDSKTADWVEATIRESSTYEDFEQTLLRRLSDITILDEASDKNRLEEHSVQTFAGRESRIPGHVLTLLRRLSEIKVLSITDARREIGREEAQKLLNLKTRRGGQERLDRIQETVSALLGVKIDAFSGEQMTPMSETRAELDVDDFVIEVNGSGIKEALGLVLDVEFQAPDILLVEEPEMHLHPALETSVMRYLREASENRQVFATTHSTNFLDTPAMKNIYLVSKYDSTSVKLLNQGEVEEQVPAELGIRLSSLFLYDRLVFVESQTDEEILRAWASALGFNLNHSNVGFIHMNGSRNISSFAARSTLSFLAQRQVRMWFLIDRDEKDERDIAKIRENLGTGAVASVLNKREIENYLIHSRISVSHIAHKQSVAGLSSIEHPEIEKIRSLIDEEANTLQEMTIHKRVAKELCNPLYPFRSDDLENMDGGTVEEKILSQLNAWEHTIARLRGEIEQETEKQKQRIENYWQTRKLDIVPGDLLIDRVYRHYGVRFHKTKGDGVELARLMNATEIGHELREMIKSIVS